MDSLDVIILASGKGERMGTETPKPLVEITPGLTLLDNKFDALPKKVDIGKVIITINSDHKKAFQNHFNACNKTRFDFRGYHVELYVEDMCLGLAKSLDNGLQQATQDYVLNMFADALILPNQLDYLVEQHMMKGESGTFSMTQDITHPYKATHLDEDGRILAYGGRKGHVIDGQYIVKRDELMETMEEFRNRGEDLEVKSEYTGTLPYIYILETFTTNYPCHAVDIGPMLNMNKPNGLQIGSRIIERVGDMIPIDYHTDRSALWDIYNEELKNVSVD
ncbi:MAG: NTP transferase domain-containing protein [Nanoarchaeota archaeon]|nr:NTP transferase domain-containing protein [Nanoarchaeota archaeon]